MITFSDEGSLQVEIQEEFDIISARARARVFAEALGFGIVDQTRIATAVSEIARNALIHGGGGKMILRTSKDKKGLEIVIVDEGPGVPNMGRVMGHEYSKSGGLGLGLAGAKRLMDEFHFESKPGVGTKVTMRKWLPSGFRW
jgi:serine/threonine-protein kinase RsbT